MTHQHRARPFPLMEDPLIRAHKLRASVLRARLKRLDHPLSHAHALNAVAALHGLGSWHALSAKPEAGMLGKAEAEAALRLSLAAHHITLRPHDLTELAGLLVGPLTQMAPLLAGEVPRGQRRQRIEQALEADHVLSAGQLARYFGADRRDLAALPSTQQVLSPLYGSREQVVVTFHARSERRLLTRRPEVLAHLCGLAELRLTLGAEPGWWQLHHDFSHAVYPSPSNGRVAAEYDSGARTAATVLERVTALALDHDRILWGCASDQQARRLGRFLRQALPKQLRRTRFTLATARWWQG